MLADMGFTPGQAKKALRETVSVLILCSAINVINTTSFFQGGNAERAVEWLFNHPDDFGEDTAPSTSAPAEPTVGGSTDVPANYRLKAFISHKGPSVHSGHYVAHIRVGDCWVLFNDEKVVKADEESVKELKQLAYLYVFEKL